MSEESSDVADCIPDDPEATKLVWKAYARVKELILEKSKFFRINTTVVRNVHRLLFRDVSPYLAGRLRSSYFPVAVTFGMHRGVPAEDVPDAMDKLELELRPLLGQLDSSSQMTQQRSADAVAVGGWYHGHIVRIHPFRDGNGRTSRVCLNYFAYRYGLREFRVLGEKDPRYIEVLDGFVTRSDSEPLIGYLKTRMLQ